jgi:polar amino acid transport system substrate-binding protein
MRQLLQNARSGAIEILDVPAPMAAPGQVLVQNYYSVVSPGTDKLAMSFARMSMLGKARSRPDLVRQVLKKMKTDGPMATYRAATSRLDAPQPLGYSSAGIVREVGPGVEGFTVGDRVACAGAGYANHAELVSVPENLVALVPDDVGLEDAAFATLGAIAMQGLRVAEPTLGELAVVVGLGIIGQLSVQLLRANGCRVLGVDLNAARVKQSLEQGAIWAMAPNEISESFQAKVTGGHGFDLALVTAASESSAPLELAADLMRRKGRISFVGAMPIELERRVMFEKELDLRMSTSYGPGRYDRNYEEVGLDYPLAYVRWTENRNLLAFLDLVDSHAISPVALGCETRPFAEAVESYEELESGSATHLAVMFEYQREIRAERSAAIGSTRRGMADGRAEKRKRPDEVGVCFIGAGTYAKSTLLPLLQRTPRVDPVTLVTATGASARGSASRFGFSGCGTDPEAIFHDPNVDLVFVTTRHDTHVDYATRALEAGKGVWLEKPAALDPEGLETLLRVARETGGFLTIGYNRRFSSHATFAARQLEGRASPLRIYYRVSPGPMPVGTWIVDPREGGGRIIGEVCHFVDLCNFFVGDLVESVQSTALGDGHTDDSITTTLHYRDGSTATIDYLGMAAADLPKEYVELSADGHTVQLDNFRHTRVLGGRTHRTLNQDKGQGDAIRQVVAALGEGQPSPLDLASIENVSRATFAMLESAQAGSRGIRCE